MNPDELYAQIYGALSFSAKALGKQTRIGDDLEDPLPGNNAVESSSHHTTLNQVHRHLLENAPSVAELERGVSRKQLAACIALLDVVKEAYVNNHDCLERCDECVVYLRALLQNLKTFSFHPDRASVALAVIDCAIVFISYRDEESGEADSLVQAFVEGFKQALDFRTTEQGEVEVTGEFANKCLKQLNSCLRLQHIPRKLLDQLIHHLLSFDQRTYNSGHMYRSLEISEGLLTQLHLNTLHCLDAVLERKDIRYDLGGATKENTNGQDSKEDDAITKLVEVADRQLKSPHSELRSASLSLLVNASQHLNQLHQPLLKLMTDELYSIKELRAEADVELYSGICNALMKFAGVPNVANNFSNSDPKVMESNGLASEEQSFVDWDAVFTIMGAGFDILCGRSQISVEKYSASLVDYFFEEHDVNRKPARKNDDDLSLSGQSADDTDKVFVMTERAHSTLFEMMSSVCTHVSQFRLTEPNRFSSFVSFVNGRINNVHKFIQTELRSLEKDNRKQWINKMVSISKSSSKTAHSPVIKSRGKLHSNAFDEMHSICKHYVVATTYVKMLPAFLTEEYGETCAEILLNIFTSQVEHLPKPETSSIESRTDIQNGLSMENIALECAQQFSLVVCESLASAAQLSESWNQVIVQSLLSNCEEWFDSSLSDKTVEVSPDVVASCLEFIVCNLRPNCIAWQATTLKEIYNQLCSRVSQMGHVALQEMQKGESSLTPTECHTPTGSRSLRQRVFSRKRSPASKAKIPSTTKHVRTVAPYQYLLNHIGYLLPVLAKTMEQLRHYHSHCEQPKGGRLWKEVWLILVSCKFYLTPSWPKGWVDSFKKIALLAPPLVFGKAASDYQTRIHSLCHMVMGEHTAFQSLLRDDIVGSFGKISGISKEQINGLPLPQLVFLHALYVLESTRVSCVIGLKGLDEVAMENAFLSFFSYFRDSVFYDALWRNRGLEKDDRVEKVYQLTNHRQQKDMSDGQVLVDNISFLGERYCLILGKLADAVFEKYANIRHSLTNGYSVQLLRYHCCWLISNLAHRETIVRVLAYRYVVGVLSAFPVLMWDEVCVEHLDSVCEYLRNRLAFQQNSYVRMEPNFLPWPSIFETLKSPAVRPPGKRSKLMAVTNEAVEFAMNWAARSLVMRGLCFSSTKSPSSCALPGANVVATFLRWLEGFLHCESHEIPLGSKHAVSTLVDTMQWNRQDFQSLILGSFTGPSPRELSQLNNRTAAVVELSRDLANSTIGRQATTWGWKSSVSTQTAKKLLQILRERPGVPRWLSDSSIYALRLRKRALKLKLTEDTGTKELVGVHEELEIEDIDESVSSDLHFTRADSSSSLRTSAVRSEDSIPSSANANWRHDAAVKGGFASSVYNLAALDQSSSISNLVRETRANSPELNLLQPKGLSAPTSKDYECIKNEGIGFAFERLGPERLCASLFDSVRQYIEVLHPGSSKKASDGVHKLHVAKTKRGLLSQFNSEFHSIVNVKVDSISDVVFGICGVPKSEHSKSRRPANEAILRKCRGLLVQLAELLQILSHKIEFYPSLVSGIVKTLVWFPCRIKSVSVFEVACDVWLKTFSCCPRLRGILASEVVECWIWNVDKLSRIKHVEQVSVSFLRCIVKVMDDMLTHSGGVDVLVLKEISRAMSCSSNRFNSIVDKLQDACLITNFATLGFRILHRAQSNEKHISVKENYQDTKGNGLTINSEIDMKYYDRNVSLRLGGAGVRNGPLPTVDIAIASHVDTRVFRQTSRRESNSPRKEEALGPDSESDGSEDDGDDTVAPLPAKNTENKHARELARQYVMCAFASSCNRHEYYLSNVQQEWQKAAGSLAIFRAQIYRCISSMLLCEKDRTTWNKDLIMKHISLLKRMHLDRLFVQSSCVPERNTIHIACQLAAVSAEVVSNTIPKNASALDDRIYEEARDSNVEDDYTAYQGSETGSVSGSRVHTRNRSVFKPSTPTGSGSSTMDDIEGSPRLGVEPVYLEELSKKFESYISSHPWILVSSPKHQKRQNDALLWDSDGPSAFMDPISYGENNLTKGPVKFPKSILSAHGVNALSANGSFEPLGDESPNWTVIGITNLEHTVSKLGLLLVVMSHELDSLYSWYNPTGCMEKSITDVEEFSLNKYASAMAGSRNAAWHADKGATTRSNEEGLAAVKEHGWGTPSIKGIGLSYGIDGKSWQYHAETAWCIDPRISIHLAKRFRSVAGYTQSVSRLIKENPYCGWNIPEATIHFANPCNLHSDRDYSLLYDSELLIYRPALPSIVARLLVRCFPAQVCNTPAIGYPGVARYVAKSLRRMTPDEILPILPQLVQALRHCQHRILENTLCYLARSSIVLAHRLLWALQAEATPTKVKTENGSLLHSHGFQQTLPGEDRLPSICQRLVASIEGSLSSREKNIFDSQHKFWEQIMNISGRLKREVPKGSDKDSKIASCLKELSSECKAEFLQYQEDISSLNRRFLRELRRHSEAEEASDETQQDVAPSCLRPTVVKKLAERFQADYIGKQRKRAYGGAAKVLGAKVSPKEQVEQGSTLGKSFETTPEGKPLLKTSTEAPEVAQFVPYSIFEETLIYLPTHPNKKVERVLLDSGKAMASAAKCPFLLSFETQPFDGPDSWTLSLLREDLEWKKRVTNDLCLSQKEQGSLVGSGSRSEKKRLKDGWARIRSKTQRTKAKMVVKRQKLRSRMMEGRTHVSEVVASKRKRAQSAVGRAVKAVGRRIHKRRNSSVSSSDSNRSHHGDSVDSIHDERSLDQVDEDFLSDGSMSSFQTYGSADASLNSEVSEHHPAEKSTVSIDSTPSTRAHNQRLSEESPPTKTPGSNFRSRIGRVFKGQRTKTQFPVSVQQPLTLQKESCILKVYDDIRQDLIAMQIIDFLAHKFETENIGLRLFPYRVIPSSTGKDRDLGGILEVVPNARSLDDLGKSGSEDLFVHFLRSQGRIDSEEFEHARSNFIKSSAAYAVACYILWVKDRHNGNIMVDNKGNMIHIDFGFLLGTSPGGNLGFETAAFKLTQEMIDVMGGDVNAEFFCEFKELCCRGLLIASEYSREIEDIVGGMADSGLDCFMFSYTLNFLRQRLRFGDSPVDTALHMNERILDSANKSSTIWYDGIQRLQQGIHSQAWQ